MENNVSRINLISLEDSPIVQQAEALKVKRLPKQTRKEKVLMGYGMLAGITNSEEFLRLKHEEKLLEDRSTE